MRNLLVVVDMQNDFIDGSLGTKEAVAIVDNVIAEIAKYDTKDIFATRDTHPENYLETQEGKNLPVVHCVKGTDGWQINEKVKTALKDAVVIDKPTFGSKILAEEITKIAEKEDITVTLVGLCTDICVVSNAILIKAYLPEIPVKVIASCCAGVTPESHEAALATMRMCQVQFLIGKKTLQKQLDHKHNRTACHRHLKQTCTKPCCKDTDDECNGTGYRALCCFDNRRKCHDSQRHIWNVI